MRLSTLTTFLTLINCNSILSYSLNKLPFTLVNPIQSNFNENTENNILKTIEPLNEIANNSVIFLPGIMSNSLPVDKLYSNFLDIMSEKNIRVYIPNENNMDTLLEKITDKKNITLVAHSNSAINAIELSNYSENINNLVLLDPINLPINLENSKYDYEIEDINNVDKIVKKGKTKINNLDNLLIIYTKKSNDWRIFPITFPIGHFGIKVTDLEIDNNIEKNIVKVDSFGHFDILDNSWSTIIHNTLSKGSNARSDDKIKLYHTWIANKISKMH